MPFFEEYLDGVLSLEYPKNLINLFIHNNVKYHKDLVAKFIANYGGEYKTVKTVIVEDNVNEADARDLAVQQTILKKSDYLFVIDSDVRIDEPQVLRILLEQNRSFIAPILTRPREVWSNFWGALSENGFYARSYDYMEIVKGEIR